MKCWAPAVSVTYIDGICLWEDLNRRKVCRGPEITCGPWTQESASLFFKEFSSKILSLVHGRRRQRNVRSVFIGMDIKHDMSV
uniref:Uncharacterized protein n=1 Tax=Timema shepardi TaxID=629360 RepID=A0A7R9B309_TIMSH|nr:unnamed protein product [Timema shepardi]